MTNFEADFKQAAIDLELAVDNYSKLLDRMLADARTEPFFPNEDTTGLAELNAGVTRAFDMLGECQSYESDPHSYMQEYQP